MEKTRRFIAAVMSAAIGISLFVPHAVMAENLSLVNEQFDGDSVPQGFGIDDEGKSSLTIEDGKLQYNRADSVSAAGGVWYDMSGLGSLSDLHCNKVIFEADMTFKGAKNHSGAAYYNNIFNPQDSEKRKVHGVYMEAVNANAKLVTAQDGWKLQPAIKAWNYTADNEGISYKFRLSVDITNSKQTFEVAEVTAETTEPEYKSFGEMPFVGAVDGTLGKFYFSDAPAWGNLTLLIDNFRITKAEPWAKMELVSVSPADGAVFKSNKPEITVEFTNAADEETFSAIVLEDENGDEVLTDKVSSGSKVIITPKNYLTYGKPYDLIIETELKDKAGQSLVSGGVYSYTTMTDPTDRNGTVLFGHNFDDGAVPENFKMTEQNGVTITNENGKLKYNRPDSTNAAGSFWYDMSGISTTGYDKIVFECEATFEGIKNHSSTSWYNNIYNPTDADGKKYHGVYMEAKGTDAILVTQQDGYSKRPAIKAWNLSDEYKGIYYKLRLTVNFADKTQTFEIAEMTADTESEVYTSFGELAFKDGVDGTIDKFYFADSAQWCNLNLLIDNFVCYAPDKPEYSGANISDGETGVSVDGAIEISFTNPIKSDSVSGITVTDKDGKPVECDFALKNGGTTVSITAKSGKFDYLSEFTVSFDKGTLQDIFGQSVSEDKTFTFTTEKIPPAKITFSSEPTYKMFDKDGNPTTDISAAKKLTASLKGVKNVSESADSKRGVALIAGIYDENGTLRAYAFDGKTLEKGNDAEFSFDLDMAENVKAGYTVRLFVWDGVPGAPYKR